MSNRASAKIIIWPYIVSPSSSYLSHTPSFARHPMPCICYQLLYCTCITIPAPPPFSCTLLLAGLPLNRDFFCCYIRYCKSSISYSHVLFRFCYSLFDSVAAASFSSPSHHRSFLLLSISPQNLPSPLHLTTEASFSSPSHYRSFLLLSISLQKLPSPLHLTTEAFFSSPSHHRSCCLQRT